MITATKYDDGILTTITVKLDGKEFILCREFLGMGKMFYPVTINGVKYTCNGAGSCKDFSLLAPKPEPDAIVSHIKVDLLPIRPECDKLSRTTIRHLEKCYKL